MTDDATRARLPTKMDPMPEEPAWVLLTGGPVSEWLDEEQVMPRSRWRIRGQSKRPGDTDCPVPDAVWLCRVEWGYLEWRARDRPEPSRGRSALYWLERERDNAPKRAVDGAYVYSHVPEGEIAQYVPEEAARAARGILRMREPTARPEEQP